MGAARVFAERSFRSVKIGRTRGRNRRTRRRRRRWRRRRDGPDHDRPDPHPDAGSVLPAHGEHVDASPASDLQPLSGPASTSLDARSRHTSVAHAVRRRRPTLASLARTACASPAIHPPSPARQHSALHHVPRRRRTGELVRRPTYSFPGTSPLQPPSASCTASRSLTSGSSSICPTSYA